VDRLDQREVDVEIARPAEGVAAQVARLSERGAGKSAAVKIPFRKSSFEPLFESPNDATFGRSRLVPSAL
jgi:hypothetical protein